MNRVRVAAVIPARMNSSRFPGKPLLEIEGIPLVEHVRRRACLAQCFSEVWVATCDNAVRQAVERFGGKVRMTSPAHPAATDRVAEAAETLDCTHVINIQGDELLVLPTDLVRMVEAIQRQPEIPAWNATAPLEKLVELSDRSVVKCTVSASGRILLCARDVSCWSLTAAEGFRPAVKILGILGYRKDFLARYGTLERTALEQAESIDQNRILEHDGWLQSILFSHGYPGINEPRELVEACGCLEGDARQQSVLAQVLAA